MEIVLSGMPVSMFDMIAADIKSSLFGLRHILMIWRNVNLARQMQCFRNLLDISHISLFKKKETSLNLIGQTFVYDIQAEQIRFSPVSLARQLQLKAP